MKMPSIPSGWIYLGIAAATALLLWGTYSLGSTSGEDRIQKKWNDQKTADLLEIQRIRDTYAALEAENRKQLVAVQKELQDAEANHQTELARITTEYDNRLRHSDTRAGVYKRQAEGGAVERSRLASHAAKLDRTLEEGRQLVAELRATVGLRDKQLESLAAQIRADRALLQ